MIQTRAVSDVFKSWDELMESEAACGSLMVVCITNTKLRQLSDLCPYKPILTKFTFSSSYKWSGEDAHLSTITKEEA